MQETQETWVWSLGLEDPLEKEMATHSRILAWKSHGRRSLVGCIVHGVAKEWAGAQARVLYFLIFLSLSLSSFHFFFLQCFFSVVTSSRASFPLAFNKIAFLLHKPIAGKFGHPEFYNLATRKDWLLSALVLNSQGWGSDQHSLDQVSASGLISRGQRVRSCYINKVTVRILLCGRGQSAGGSVTKIGQISLKLSSLDEWSQVPILTQSVR